jgi:hypothetical protein
MSMTRAQARAWGRGTVATIDREKDKQTIYFKVEYPIRVREDHITDAVRHALFVRGGLDQATSRIEVARDLPDYRRLLNEKDDALKAEQGRSAQMADELERLRKQIAALPRADTREWITMTELAARQQVCPATIWRAHKAGRLETRRKGGGSKRDQYLCDPTTYVPAIRNLTKK